MFTQLGLLSASASKREVGEALHIDYTCNVVAGVGPAPLEMVEVLAHPNTCQAAHVLAREEKK